MPSQIRIPSTGNGQGMQGTTFIHEFVRRITQGEDATQLRQEILAKWGLGDLEEARAWRDQLSRQDPERPYRQAICSVLLTLEHRHHSRFLAMVDILPYMFRQVASLEAF